jgi:tetratricopeptide (TPR) repeat protein
MKMQIETENSQVQAPVIDKAAERAARLANSPDLWNKLWADESQEEWRKQALNQVYTRIERLLPEGSSIVDLGGGVGVLGRRLRDSKKARVLVVDHSEEALKKAADEGLEIAVADLEKDADLERVLAPDVDFVVATEVVEHLNAETRERLFRHAAQCGKALLSVPNDRLGPDEEPQHTVKYNAMSFKNDLQKHFEHVRIEVLGPYLLGVCGFPKKFTLSVTMPCRDEGADLEATLASFRGVADEIVIGIDPRTVDNTREIALKYADVVFDLKEPEGKKDDKAPDSGVHFGWIRNQCIDRCTSQWIFMTEGHERLVSGWEALLSLNRLPAPAKIGFVLRTGTGQQWAFPWLFRNDKNIRFKRKTHNVLDYPNGTYVIQMPQVRTLHERAEDRELARAVQRKTQNRLTLLEDWVVNQNENSLHYLGAEWREHDPAKALRYMEEFLQLPKKNGAMHYHTRLLAAKLYAAKAEALMANNQSPKEELAKARKVLLGATEDDWSRTEHWVWLGDLAYNEEKYEEALQFYLYAGTRVGEPPFTLWWVDLSCYSWLPAQRLAMTFGELGRLSDSLYWARKVLELLPDDAESWAFEEAQANITLLEESIENGSRRETQ